MRKLLMTAAVLVALATPAMAITAAPPDPPLGSTIYLIKNGFIDHVIPFETCSEGQGD